MGWTDGIRFPNHHLVIAPNSMSRLARWILLNIALGVFPIGVRLLLRVANAGGINNDFAVPLRNSSDILTLALTVTITTFADLRRTNTSAVMSEKAGEIWMYVIGAYVVISAVWFGIQEATLIGHPIQADFRDNSFGASVVFMSMAFITSIILEATLNRLPGDEK